MSGRGFTGCGQMTQKFLDGFDGFRSLIRLATLREKSDQSSLDWRSPFEGLLSFRLLRLVLELRVPCLCDLGEGGRERGEGERESIMYM